MNVSVEELLMFLGEEVVKNRLLERENATLKERLQEKGLSQERREGDGDPEST